MNVAGIYLKSNVLRIIALSGTRANHRRIAERVHKIELSSTPEQEDIRALSQTIRAYCAEHSIDLICINRRVSRGTHAGGASTFRHEGVILATSPVPVRQIHQATIAATERRDATLKQQRPGTADLGRAYDLAFEGLD